MPLLTRNQKIWIEQSEPNGGIFADSYLHNECEYIRHWNSREEWLNENKLLKEIKKCRLFYRC